MSWLDFSRWAETMGWIDFYCAPPSRWRWPFIVVSNWFGAAWRIFRFRLGDYPRAVLRFWQRGRRGWSYMDASYADLHIAKIMVGILQANIEASLSCPGTEEWREIMLDMQAGFVAHLEIAEHCPDEERTKHLIRLEKRGLTLFKRWFSYLWP